MMDQAYKTLRDEWYLRLKDEGFEEIENVNSPTEWLINWDSTWFRIHTTPEAFLEKQQYYYMADIFLNAHNFQTEFEKHVWALHSEGLSMREIAKELESNKDKVNQIVSNLIRYMRLGF